MRKDARPFVLNRNVRKSPVHDVQRMCPPSSEKADGVVVHIIRSGARAPVYRIGTLRCGTEPEIVVESLRDRRRIQGPAAGAGRRIDVDLPYLAEITIAHEFTREGTMGVEGALLCAVLKHAAIAVHRRAECLVVGDADPERLFYVEVLPGPCGCQGDRHMPVVGCRNDHSIDAWIIEQIPEVLVHGTTLIQAALFLACVPAIHQLCVLLPAGSEQIANGDAPGTFHLEESPQQSASLPSDTNVAQRDLPARREFGDAPPCLRAQRCGTDC